ncbi:hypothetical protein, partial [Helicobacter pylori]|uniref:hypothetical protein n=1 Tax=Helicobacter pylori TaxID=210 RepID=UPI001F3FF684
MVQIHSPQPIFFKNPPPIFLSYPFKKMLFNLPTPPNKHYQTKQKALKSKNDKNFKKMTKKK